MANGNDEVLTIPFETADEKTAPVAADAVPLADSEDAGAPKRLRLASLFSLFARRGEGQITVERPSASGGPFSPSKLQFEGNVSVEATEGESTAEITITGGGAGGQNADQVNDQIDTRVEPAAQRNDEGQSDNSIKWRVEKIITGNPVAGQVPQFADNPAPGGPMLLVPANKAVPGAGNHPTTTLLQLTDVDESTFAGHGLQALLVNRGADGVVFGHPTRVVSALPDSMDVGGLYFIPAERRFYVGTAITSGNFRLSKGSPSDPAIEDSGFLRGEYGGITPDLPYVHSIRFDETNQVVVFQFTSFTDPDTFQTALYGNNNMSQTISDRVDDWSREDDQYSYAAPASQIAFQGADDFRFTLAAGKTITYWQPYSIPDVEAWAQVGGGAIPDARLSANIARTNQIPATLAASAITLRTSGFDGNLSSSVGNVQALADAVDALTAGTSFTEHQQEVFNAFLSQGWEAGPSAEMAQTFYQSQGAARAGIATAAFGTTYTQGPAEVNVWALVRMNQNERGFVNANQYRLAVISQDDPTDVEDSPSNNWVFLTQTGGKVYYAVRVSDYGAGEVAHLQRFDAFSFNPQKFDRREIIPRDPNPSVSRYMAETADGYPEWRDVIDEMMDEVVKALRGLLFDESVGVTKPIQAYQSNIGVDSGATLEAGKYYMLLATGFDPILFVGQDVLAHGRLAEGATLEPPNAMDFELFDDGEHIGNIVRIGATVAGNALVSFSVPAQYTVKIVEITRKKRSASEVGVSSAGFTGNLSVTDNTVQKALDKFDALEVEDEVAAVQTQAQFDAARTAGSLVVGRLYPIHG